MYLFGKVSCFLISFPGKPHTLRTWTGAAFSHIIPHEMPLFVRPCHWRRMPWSKFYSGIVLNFDNFLRIGTPPPPKKKKTKKQKTREAFSGQHKKPVPKKHKIVDSPAGHHGGGGISHTNLTEIRSLWWQSGLQALICVVDSFFSGNCSETDEQCFQGRENEK